MGEIYYTIKVAGSVVAQNIRAVYVPMIVKGMLAEWSANYGLEISIEAQDPTSIKEG